MPIQLRFATLLCVSSVTLFAQSYTITTVAGTNRVLDGSPATAVPLRDPRSVAFDSAGNLYIADAGDNRVRRVSSQGTISTYAGTGAPGFAGDGGKATSALLASPTGIAFDSSNNLYIADRDNDRVRRVATDGTITTVAGNCASASRGDGGKATLASVRPYAVAVDNKGTLYIADIGARIRKVDANGNISTIAGTGTIGFSGDKGPATAALIGIVVGLAIDSRGDI